MQALKLSVFVACFILLVGVETVFGIKCYVCNSGYQYGGDDCLDREKLKNSDYLVDCAEEEARDHVANGTYKYCRIFGQTVRSEYRLIRQCASDGRTDKCIERTGTKEIKLSYCHCDQDGCNGASNLYSPITLLLALTTGVWLFAQRT